MKKKPPVEVSEAEMAFLGTLKERDRRHFISEVFKKPLDFKSRVV